MDPTIQVALNDVIQQFHLMSAKAHHWHLTTRSYSAHMALGELYEYLPDAADKLSETAQGAGLNPSALSNSKVQVAFSGADQAIKETEAFLVEVETLRGKVTSLAWLDNILQEIQGTLYGILFKLKRLS
jgi:DNA-binding ferritin-like protein